MNPITTEFDRARRALTLPQRQSIFFDIRLTERTVRIECNTQDVSCWKPEKPNRRTRETLRVFASVPRTENEELRLCEELITYADPKTGEQRIAPLFTRGVIYDPESNTFLQASARLQNEELIAYLATRNIIVDLDTPLDVAKLAENGIRQLAGQPVVVLLWTPSPRSLASSLDWRRYPQILGAPAALRMFGALHGDRRVSDFPIDDQVLGSLKLDPDQRRAAKLAAAGTDLVIEGPPGTGKSQVITAIVALLTSSKKRILITSTEKAALDVAQRRVRNLGLACEHDIVFGTPKDIAEACDPPEGEHLFDTVIIDEASRMPIREGWVVLSRARCVVVIGDSKQMLPEDGELDVLSAAHKADFEHVTLRFHYRSMHRQLISMSNILVYGMELRTVPVPSITTRDGVSAQCFPDGIASSTGNGLTNPTEANAIVEYIKALLADGDKRSIGVIAMNTQQSTLITRLIKAQIDGRYSRTDEPLFVRTTNDIQGEERDIILISGTYSPRCQDTAQRFGVFEANRPIQRLNVMLSRARSHMRLFISFCAEDLNYPLTPGGVAMLALTRGFEELTSSDFRQEPSPVMYRIARQLRMEPDHLGVVVGFRRQLSTRYAFGLVIRDNSKTPEHWNAIIDQLHSLDWLIIDTTDDELIRVPEATINRIKAFLRQ